MKAIRMVAMGVALLVGVTVASTTANAQGGGQRSGMRSGGGRMNMMSRLLQGIDLTSEQRAKIDSISEAFRAQMPAMTPGQRPDSAARAARREAMQKETDAIRAVLTPDQQKTFDKNVEEMRSRMGRRGGGGPGGR